VKSFRSPHFSSVRRVALPFAAALLISAAAFAQVAVEEPSVSEPAPVISADEAQVLRASSSPAPIIENSRPGAPVSDTPRRFHYFLDNTQNNTVQQVVHLAASHRFGHLALSLAQDIQILDGTDLNSLTDPTGNQANTDVRGRNKHQVYNTQLSGSYDLTGKLFLSGGGSFSADEYQSSLISSQVFSGNLFLNYNYSDKLVLGVGGTGGYNTTNPSINDQTFEQANVRLNYSATAKISLSASGGVEFRQFGSSSGNNVSPVYTLAASYQPFDGTTMSLTGSRHTMNSASLAGQDFAETNISVSVTQRFMQRFYFGFAAGYTNSNYFSTISGVSDTRNDDFYYIDPSVDFNVTRFWTFGAYYVHREDTSSFPFFSFKDNQVGIRTKLTF